MNADEIVRAAWRKWRHAPWFKYPDDETDLTLRQLKRIRRGAIPVQMAGPYECALRRIARMSSRSHTCNGNECASCIANDALRNGARRGE